MGINVSSVAVDEGTPFKIVADATASTDANSVDLEFGPSEDQLNAADYLTKTDVADASKWAMGAEGAADANLGIETDGHVSHVAQDITQQSKFGTIKWYLKATNQQAQVTESNTLVTGSEFNSRLNSLGLDDRKQDFKNLAVVQATPDTVNGTLVSDATGEFPVYATLDTTTSTITLTSEADEIVLNENCRGMFQEFYALASLDASRFDTSRVTDMSYMFFDVPSLRLNCSDWDVSNVTNHEEFNEGSTLIIAPHWVN